MPMHKLFMISRAHSKKHVFVLTRKSNTLRPSRSKVMQTWPK